MFSYLYYRCKRDVASFKCEIDPYMTLKMKVNVKMKVIHESSRTCANQIYTCKLFLRSVHSQTERVRAPFG